MSTSLAYLGDASMFAKGISRGTLLETNRLVAMQVNHKKLRVEKQV